MRGTTGLLWLMALLIVVAYFVGAATETNSLANGLTKLVLAFTGRDPTTGQFAAYPTGATVVQGG